MNIQSENTGLAQITEDSILFDFYGGLLTEKQQEIFRLYHEDNLSLSEISQELDMSRQGVHDAVKKAVCALRSYEKKLALAEKFQRYTLLLEQMKKSVHSAKQQLNQDGEKDPLMDQLNQIDRWIGQLLEEASR